MSANAKKYKKAKGYESLKREFLQRNDLSLEARGLLAYMESMPDDYIFHKNNLYKCFAKNKRTSVERIWNELLDNHFIIAFSKGKAPKQDFEYLFTHEGFSEQEIEDINEEYLSQGWEVAYRSGTNRKPSSYYRNQAKNVKKEENLTPQEGSDLQGVENQHPDNHGISSGVDFEQHKLNSSKSTGNKLTNKGLTINDDDDEKIKKGISESEIEITKTVQAFCDDQLHLDESLQTLDSENIRVIKTELENSYWEIGEKQTKAHFKQALDYTLENIIDPRRFGAYLAKNMQLQALKWNTVNRVKETEAKHQPEFYIPMAGFEGEYYDRT